MDRDYEWTTALGGDETFVLRRGRRARTGTPVLVKLPRHDPPRPADVAALRREGRLAGELSSAATLLPRVLDAPPGVALVMEDPGGEPLTRLLADGPLPVPLALAVGEALARRLAELHHRGIVHRGLRPDAVLCDADRAGVWLVDLAGADRPVEGLPTPALSTARLVYAAPEQTGRLERDVDHRTDLYALGVLLYELLSGAPPFRAADALALIHAHLAGTPAPVPGVPAPLASLVARLLAKSPDERYQSARGVAEDLAHCARAWRESGDIAPFPLGGHDAGERLVVSPRLYGRDREVRLLLDAFDATCRGGGSSLVLVQGYAGIGKTALIQQIYKPIVRQHGYFISGKFDQVVRGVPFGALIEAFRALVRQLLTEDEAALAAWRRKLHDALGANGGVLAAVIPEIEFIVGPQPAPAQLGGTEAQNRFQHVLQNFLAALARPEHPLVLFLDDLQWADAATLGLLEPLLTGGEARCLMLLGAYRDHELEASPRLLHALAALDAAGVPLRRVALAPLTPADTARLVADTLRCDDDEAAPLAQLVHAKTRGNPFFVIQFLKLLEREGHLRFDAALARWTYRIEAITGAPLAANVVDLMTRSLQRLAPRTQYALTLAACIGNRFDARTLAIVSEQSLDATAADLLPALNEGLIVRDLPAVAAGAPGGDEVMPLAFLHDRVQQAAYALIPDERRHMVHLTVGRLLRARLTPDPPAAALFDVVHHLNLGGALIHDATERHAVAELNLVAGRRAKASTAHDAALELLRAGLALLGPTAWLDQHTLSFEMQIEAAECEYLCGQFDAAEARFALLVEQALTPIARARAIRLRSVQHENLARYDDALASMREGLALLDLHLPSGDDAQAASLEREIEAIDRLRDGRAIAALVDLPVMRDERVRMLMSMLTDTWSSAYILGQATLARLISATMVRLSLEHGNVEESAYGYVTHAITVGPLRGDYPAAYEFGRLALAVNQRFDDTRRRAKIHQQFHAHVNFWCRPYASGLSHAREACRAGLESGDFLYASYGAGTEPWSAIACTQDLARFVHDYAPSVALIEKLKNTGFADSVRVMLNWARALQGRTAAPLSLGDASLDEADFLARYRDNAFFSSIHAVCRLQVCCLLGAPDEAVRAARHAAALVRHVPGVVWPLLHEFWSALALAMAHEGADAASRAGWLDEIRAAGQAFAARSAHCAENFLCPALVLAAELARLEGRPRDAAEQLARAVEFAADKPLVQWEALAHERWARLLDGDGQPAVAALHWQRAHQLYARWGADAKVAALEHEHPGLRPRDAALPVAPVEPPPPSAAASSADDLDLHSVLKATQAIGAEMELDTLLGRLMRIAIENAGAERGCLVLETDDGPTVYAADAQRMLCEATALAACDKVPAGVVNYVRRTGESVVLDGTSADDRYGADAYIAARRPRSVMCLPVRHQGRAAGVLYLENAHVDGAFTAGRLRALRVLATQAAISLENARLVAGLKSALTEVERLKDGLEAENSYLRRDLIANVSHDLRTPLVSMRGYLEVLAGKGDTLAPAQRRHYLEIAVRQSERLSSLVDELFELAKLDFKGVTLRREPFQLAELASDVLQKFQLAADAKEVALALDARPGLPCVDADLGLMERVLENLVANALRHTPPGGRVEVRLRRAGDRLQTEVADTGRGIAAADLPYIFERFYRGGPDRHRAADGAGLGLAITQRILELHGSAAEVASEPGRGTCFAFGLPVAAARAC